MQRGGRFSAIAGMYGIVAAQASGLLLADSGWTPSGLFIPVAMAAAGAAVVAGPRLRAALALAAVCCASGGALAQRIDRAVRERPLAAGVRTIEGRVESREARKSGLRLDLARVVATDGEGPVPGAVRVQGPEEGTLSELSPGDVVRVRAELDSPVGARNPGGRDLARALARQGIGGFARPVHPLLVARRVDGGAGGAKGTIEGLRTRAMLRLGREGPGGALLRALACGDRGGLPDAVSLAFRELGLSHLLSVSGLHLVLVAGLVYAAAGRALRRIPGLAAGHDIRQVALAVAVTASALYAVFSGFGVPVQRALVFIVAAGAALLRRRPLRAQSALATAACLVLAARPSALFDAGAQMSFAASLALLLLRRDDALAGPGATRALRLRRSLRALLSTSAAAGAATAPIAATHMGVIAPAGLAANLLFVPWTGAVLLPGALLAAGLSCLPGEGSVRDALIAFCAGVAVWSCDVAEHLARWSPDPPGVEPPAAAMLAACLVLAVGAARARRLSARIACAAVSCLGLALSGPAPIDPRAPRVVFLDVGQGDAVLVQGLEGALLVDAGARVPDGPDLGATVVVPALRALGVARLDVVVASHGDLDHRGGLPAVLREIPVARVWLPFGGAGDPAFSELVTVAHLRGAIVEEVGAGSAPRRVGDLDVAPLWPPAGAGGDSRNDRSLTLRVGVAGRTVLLPGDLGVGAEARLLAGGTALRAEVLKLGHHGSRTSSSSPWLAAVGAEVAVASAPRAGRFGMPHPEVVARAGEAGAALWWTGRDGAVLIGLGPVLEVRGWRR